MSAHTPGPWEYVPSTAHHGPYVANGWGAGDICDCYVMSQPHLISARNGGESRPIHMQYDQADANARLIAAAPALLAELADAVAFMKERMAQDGDSGVSILIRHAEAAIGKAKGEAK